MVETMVSLIERFGVTIAVMVILIAAVTVCVVTLWRWGRPHLDDMFELGKTHLRVATEAQRETSKAVIDLNRRHDDEEHLLSQMSAANRDGHDETHQRLDRIAERLRLGRCEE